MARCMNVRTDHSTPANLQFACSYENLVQIRLLLEQLVSPEEMLSDWHTLLPHYMQTWDLNRDDVRPYTLEPRQQQI